VNQTRSIPGRIGTTTPIIPTRIKATARPNPRALKIVSNKLLHYAAVV
jgi:hypothetical protein